MPIYVYQSNPGSGCDHCLNGFEKLQKVSAQPLLRCPRCGVPIRKLLTAPNLASKSPDLGERNIEKHGFTQYRKREKGVYEKTVGKGPKLIGEKN